MAQKSVGIDVFSGLFCRRRGHSRQPVCATPAGESWVHPHPDDRRESVLRFDPDRDGGADSLVMKEEASARFAYGGLQLHVRRGAICLIALPVGFVRLGNARK